MSYTRAVYSLLRLRHHFLSCEVEKLAAESQILDEKYLTLKGRLEAERRELGRLRGEREEFEGRAGLVTEVHLLRDYQRLEEDLQREIRRNTDTSRRLGGWWEGFRKSGENI